MELPVIGGRHNPTSQAMVRALRKARLELGRAAAQHEESIEGAVLLSHPARRNTRTADAALDVHCPEGCTPSGVLAEIDETFRRWRARCTLIAPTEVELDASWANALDEHGFTTVKRRVLILTRDVTMTPHPQTFQAVPARALLPHYLQFVEADELTRGCSVETAREIAANESDHFDVDGFDAIALRRSGAIVASVSIQTVGEFGIVGEVRGRRAGAASPEIESILWHLLDLCRRSQFRRVIAATDPADRFFTEVCSRLGMEEAASMMEYIRPAAEAHA